MKAGPQKGRGATANPEGRFERVSCEPIDDGWGVDEADPAPVQTEVSVDNARTVIAWNDSPDVPFDRSVNPYRGCEHGCVYCFARPSHGYLGLSPGLDFESKLVAKPWAAERLESELGDPRYRCAPMGLGTNTDPYQPIEKQWGITRQVLETLGRWNHPVTIVTKSSLIERDIDLLADMAERDLVSVNLSVTTLDRELMRRLEPRAAAPQRRIQTMARLKQAGIPVGVLVAPVIPVLTDGDLEAILEACAGAGAESAAYLLLRLPHEVGDLFQAWLDTHYPLKAEHVMARVRETRGGRANDPRFGTRHTGEGPYAEMIAARFHNARRRLGLGTRERVLSTEAFAPPLRSGDQLPLL